MSVDIGQAAPSFSLPDEAGHIHHLTEYQGNFVILYFYPKDNTPGCSQEAQEFAQLIDNITNLQCVVLGISRDTQASHAKFKAKLNLPFPLLSDADSAVCQAYDVIKEKNMYGKKVMGIERSTFILDDNGKIAAIYRKVKVKGHAAQVLEALQLLRTK